MEVLKIVHISINLKIQKNCLETFPTKKCGGAINLFAGIKCERLKQLWHNLSVKLFFVSFI